MRHALTALALALPLLAQAAEENLVLNGGFESTLVGNGSWVNVASLEGWQLLAGPGGGFEVRNNVAGAAHEGRNFIELATTADTTIGQSFASLSAGQHYTLSFAYSPRPGTNAVTNGLAVYWNGVQLGAELNGAGAAAHRWTVYQFDVVAASGLNQLSFRSFGGNDSLGASLDSVRMVRAVPEPASAALLLVGLGVVALKRRRGG